MIDIDKFADYLKKNGFTYDVQGGKWDYTNGPYVVPYVVEDLNWYEDHISIFSDLIIINDIKESDDHDLEDLLRTNSKSTDVRTYREFVVEINDFIKKYHEILKEIKKNKIMNICKEEL